jgi:3-hydroxyanthranilate 3,4-dioxygenase
MLIGPLTNFNLGEYLAAHRADWEASDVVRKLIWEDSEYIAFLNRGPQPEPQYHINPGDEIFYQLEGELDFHYISAEGEHRLLVTRPGEFFLLPARVPHSVRRPAGSWTLVIERQRRPDEEDGWAWYCEECHTKLHETWVKSGGPRDTVAGRVPPFIVEGASSVRALKSCPRCGGPVPVDA